jgi:hypothetical protein
MVMPSSDFIPVQASSDLQHLYKITGMINRELTYESIACIYSFYD